MKIFYTYTYYTCKIFDGNAIISRIYMYYFGIVKLLRIIEKLDTCRKMYFLRIYRVDTNNK